MLPTPHQQWWWAGGEGVPWGQYAAGVRPGSDRWGGGDAGGMGPNGSPGDVGGGMGGGGGGVRGHVCVCGGGGAQHKTEAGRAPAECTAGGGTPGGPRIQRSVMPRRRGSALRHLHFTAPEAPGMWFGEGVRPERPLGWSWRGPPRGPGPALPGPCPIPRAET